MKCDSCGRYTDIYPVLEYSYTNEESDLQGIADEAIEVKFGFNFSAGIDLCPRCMMRLLATAMYKEIPEDVREIFHRTFTDLVEHEADEKSKAAKEK